MSDGNCTVRYRPLQGFPGYRVGDDGSIWSCWRRVGFGDGGGSTTTMSDVWHRLKANSHRVYSQVVLRRGKSFHGLLVHRAVLEAFVGPCPDGMEACHFPDSNPRNNALSNLRWDTSAANKQDMIKQGRQTNIGERNLNAKLNATIVKQARKSYAAGSTFQSLADRYGVTIAAMYKVIVHKTWKHVE